jgi:hypothetical protein
VSTPAPGPALQPPVVQRALTDGESPLPAPPTSALAAAPSASSNSGAEPAPPNLDELAEQILPIIKRMMAVERERRTTR